jgi:hypothetical protein
VQKDYLPLINALFSEVNPIPGQGRDGRDGYCENYVRLR